MPEPQSPSTGSASSDTLTDRSDVEFRAIAELVPDLLWEGAPDGRLTWYNRRWTEYTGHHLDEAVGNRYLEAVHPDDRQSAAARFQQGMESGRPFRLECRLQNADGAYRWFQVRVRPVEGSDGQIERWFGAATDIDERKRTESELRRAKIYAESIVETIHEPLLVLTPDLRVQSANPAFYDQFQVHADETLGQLIYELGQGEWDIPALRTLLEDVLPDDQSFDDFLVEHTFTEIGERVMLVNARRLDHVQLILLGIRDVTEHRRVRDALQRNQDRVLQLLHQLPVGVGIMDRDGTWRIKNPMLDRLAPGPVPYTDPEQHDRWRAWGPNGGHLPPSEWPGPRALRGEAVQPGVDFLHTTADGNERWVRVAATPFRDGDGELAGAVVVAEDVTEREEAVSERRAAEQALRESEARLRSVLNNSLDVAYRRDLRSDTYDYVSPAVEQVLGISPEDFQQMSLRTLMGRIHPDDRERVTQAHRQATGSGRGSAEYRFEVEQGRYRWVADQFTVQLGEDGTPISRTGIVRDVSEQKHTEEVLRASEERYALAARATSNAIWDWDLETDHVKWNRGLYEIFGYGPDEVEPTGRWWKDRIHPEDRDRVVAGLDDVTAEEDESLGWQARYRLRRADGTWAHVSDRGYLARDREGRAVRMVGAVTDVTAARTAELERERRLAAEREAREAAEHANEVKSQFLSTLSHELRTPLNAVIGFADLMDSEALGGMNEKQKDYLGRIRGSAWHLVHLIDEILTFSRTEAGKERTEIDEVDVAELIRGTMEMLTYQARSANLSLELSGAEEPLVMSTDPGKVRQIITNLVGNAIKYTDDGGVEVELSIRGDWVEMQVRDTGPGIPPDRLEEIFDPFQQLDGSSTRHKGGTGLGLTICRRLARLLDGDVSVESVVGQGSTFTVKLPKRGGA